MSSNIILVILVTSYSTY